MDPTDPLPFLPRWLRPSVPGYLPPSPGSLGHIPADRHPSQCLIPQPPSKLHPFYPDRGAFFGLSPFSWVLSLTIMTPTERGE